MSFQGRLSRLIAMKKTLRKQIAREYGLENCDISAKEDLFTGDNYMGDITRVKITPTKASGLKSIGLFLKHAPVCPVAREYSPIAQFYRTEAYMYNRVLPAFHGLQDEYKIPSHGRFRTAKCYKAITDEYKEKVIMQDLSCEGFMMWDKRKPFNMEHTTKIVQYLAKLHASSFALKEKEPELFAKFTSNICNSMNYGVKVRESVSSTILKTLCIIDDPSTRKKVENFAEKSGDILDRVLDATQTAPYNVICHGDCWGNNMLFRYMGRRVIEVVMVDWQIARYASPCTDLAYMFFMLMDEDSVEKNLKFLLNLYYTTLKRTLSSMKCEVKHCYPEEVFIDHFEKIKIFGLIMELMGLPFVLKEPGEATKLDADFNAAEETIHVSEETKARMNGILNYFVKRDLI